MISEEPATPAELAVVDDPVEVEVVEPVPVVSVGPRSDRVFGTVLGWDELPASPPDEGAL